MADEKDRFGDKLRQKEKADEDRYFAARDTALLEKLKQEKDAAREEDIRALARMRCPKDGERLVTMQHHGVTVEECPTCHGVWLDKGEIQHLASRERDSWLGRFFFRPKL
jgi:hypothetical protein